MTAPTTTRRSTRGGASRGTGSSGTTHDVSRRLRRGSVRTLAADWLDRPLASFHLLMAVFVLMLGFGLVMVLSSSAATAFQANESAFAVFINQAIFALLGLVAFALVVRLPVGLIRRTSTMSLIICLTLLAAVLIPGIGSKWNGARSWITIGSNISFQPSEVAKLALLLWAGHVMASVRSPSPSLKSMLIPVAPVVGIMGLLIMLQPDLGTTVTLGIVFLAVLFFAGTKMRFFAVLAGLAGVGIILLANVAGYRVARIDAWLHPATADPQSTYQSFQGLYAMGSGGVFGVGIGQSKMKWGRLPNADSDFIFAIIGEELGLIGTLTVIGLFALLAYVGLRIARRNTDPFVKIVAASATVWLVGQAAINIGYVVGLLPVTGIPLPMFSRGGTSLVVTIVVFGLLANFARREPAAAAALASATPRGIAAYLGIGRRSKIGRAPSRAAAKRAEKVRRARESARQSDSRPSAERFGRGADPTPRPARQGAAPRRGQARRPGAATRSYPPRAAGRTRGRRHPIRRALGFPVPEPRAGRPGRTVRP